MKNLSDDNIDRFNEMAKGWDEDPVRVKLAQAVSAAIRKELDLTGAERALEFGCGTGLVTVELAPSVAHIVAMDGSPNMLQVLRAKCLRQGCLNITLRNGVLPDQMPDETFDLIFSSMVLHHIEDTGAVLRILFRHLTVGGRVALGDLDAEDGSFHDNKQGVAHHGFDRGELAALLCQAGFDQVHLLTTHQIEKQDYQGIGHKYSTFLAVASKADA